MKNQNINIVQTYFNSIATGDLNILGSLFSEDVIWHQPGNGQLSGVHQGNQAVFDLFGKFMKISDGSFKIDSVKNIMANKDLVTTVLHFTAQKNTGEKISMNGVDLMRIENGKIKEVYLFSENQPAEDAFWRQS